MSSYGFGSSHNNTDRGKSWLLLSLDVSVGMEMDRDHQMAGASRLFSFFSHPPTLFFEIYFSDLCWGIIQEGEA